MDRDGAETYLRLLAEGAMRGSLAPAAEPGPPGTSRMMVVAHALTAVGALDPPVAEEILNDFRLAVTVRLLRTDPIPGPGQPVTAAQWISQGRAVPHRSPPAAGPPQDAPSEDDAGQGQPDRFVPVGLTVPFRAGVVSGELCLMSFAQTSSGARFIAAWEVSTPELDSRLGRQHPGLIPFGEFTVTDDRGVRYQLDHTPGGDLEWPNEISLRPAPAEDIRWLDVAPPYRRPVRVDLRPPGRYGEAGSPPVRGVTGGSSPGGDAAQISDIKLSAGEHLLVMLAERLLSWTPVFPHGGRPAGPPAGPWRAMAAGFGDIIAALEAAGVLSQLSPVPARLATLCASLDLNGHGIAAPPAHDLPEPWLSLLAYYQRRKPDPAQMRDGYAVDYSYRRPSRRSAVAGPVVLPALRRPVPEVAVVCDTSGSMTDDLLAQVLAEVEGLLRALGLARQVRVLACDTAVAPVQRVSSARQVQLIGGGGTDMGAGISAAAALRPRPAVTVVLTDGYTPWPAAAPKGMRVVVGLIGAGAPDAPSWTRAVRVEP